MNYYEHHLGDYAEATAHLSFVEDAAYSRMIRKYYATEKPLPSEKNSVQRLIGARTKDEKEAVSAVLDEFFVLRDDGWHNTRCDEEIARFKDKQEKAKRSAEARWNKQKPHSEGNANASPDAMRTHSEGNAHQTPDTRHQSPDTSLYLHKDTQSSSPTRASAVCVALRAEGIASVNPSHQDLLDLLDDGAEIQDFVSAARIAKEKGKGFAYLIGIVKGQRADAQRVREERPQACVARQPAQQDRLPAWRRDEIRRQFESTPNLVPAELLPQIGIDPATRRPFAKHASEITVIDTTAKEIGHEPARDVG